MWSQWYLVKEKNTGGVAVKRYKKKPDKKYTWQRYPAKEYKHLPMHEVESLIKRLNATRAIEEQEAKARYDFDHTFINKRLIERFELYISRDITDSNHQQRLISNLNDYVFGFWVLEKKLPDPKFWKRHEVAYGEWLTKKLAIRTSLQVIALTNRYLRFLHEELPSEVPIVVLRPLGRKKIKQMKQVQISEGQRKKWIKPDLFEEIMAKFPVKLVPACRLMYYFGLRNAESLGLKPDDLMKPSLDVKRQLDSFTNGKKIYTTLKDIDVREVPYWFATPAQAFKWIKALAAMHPDTFSKKVNKAFADLGYEFEAYDFRRSFVTNAHAAKKDPLEIQQACGHEEWDTTMGYMQSMKQENKEQWRPE